jgi:hypothetical protein
VLSSRLDAKVRLDRRVREATPAILVTPAIQVIRETRETPVIRGATPT